MTKQHTKEVRPSPPECSPRTHSPSSKPDQNEQNSKLTDGAYFWLDGYPSIPVVTKRRLHFFWDLLGKALVKGGGLTKEGADRLVEVVGIVFGQSGAELG